MQAIEASRKKYDAGLRRTSGDRYITSDPIGILRDYSDPGLQVALDVGMLEETGFAGEELNHPYGYVGQNPLFWYDPYGLAKGQNKGKPVNPNRNPDKKKGGGSGTGTKKGDGSRPRNVGIDEEHSRRPKGGFRLPGVPLLICPICPLVFPPSESPPACI